jgi:D-amino-acid dehydrogenase
VAKQHKTALVVGGGIVGLACAHGLAREGFATTILDEQSESRPASWGNAGHLAVEQVEPLASLDSFKRALQLLLKGGGPIATPAGDLRAWLPFFLRMARASGRERFHRGTAVLTACMERAMPAWRRLVADAGCAGLLIEQGHYVVWESARTAKEALARWRQANTGAATWREATAAELAQLRALVASRLYAAIRFEGSGQIRDPGLLLGALKASIGAAGGTFVQARATAIVPADTGTGAVSVTSDDGSSRTADVILIAAGVDSGRLLRQTGTAVPIIAERGYHIQSPPDAWPGDLPPIVFEDRSMVVTGFQSALRATSFVEFARHERPATEARWSTLERHIDELGLPFGKPRSRWMGARPTLPDYLPAIGRSSVAANLFYAFGHQHLGLTTAAVTGELVGDLVCGRETAVDLRPFDVARFSRRR